MHKIIIFLLCLIISRNFVSAISSKIRTCTSEENCSSLLEIQLALSFGNNEQLEFTVDSSVNSKGEVIPHLAVKGSIKKSPPVAIYPLIYQKTFNGKPSESIIYKTDFLIPSCDDSPKSKSPTCGWTKNQKGENIEGSQGFCCSCSAAQMVGIDNERSRGNLNCGFLQMKSSAHCMRLHEVDWDGYEIEPFTTKFEITVDLGILGKAKVSPFTKVATLNSGGSVALNGDFSQYKALPTFESKMLFVPAYPKNHPIVLEGSKNWMLVDKNMVTMSGSECDKIGVSFSAFRNQPNACSQLPLSCLGNQLEDLRQTDIALMKEGSRSGKYIISNFGSFLMNSTGAQKTLIMDTSEDTNSVLTIFVNAASVQFLSQKSAGHIVSAFVKPFVAMSKEGEMQITVSNTGTSECSYIITITDCSENILPILQQRVVITPAETVTEHFEIRTSHEFATSNRCKVTLLYSDGEKIQDIIVVFDSKDYAFEKAIDGSIDQTGKVNIEGDHSNSQCKCNSPFDVICIVLHSCIDYIIGWVAAIVGIITIPIIFVFMWRCGLFSLLFQSCKCCACCCSLLPRGIMKCLIGPYKKKKHRRKSKKSKKKRNSSENSERKSKKKKKQRKNRYRSSMRMNDSLPYHPSSYVMMNPQSMARYYKPSPSYEMKEIEYEPVARYYK